MKMVKVEILKIGYKSTIIKVNGQITSVPSKYIKEIYDPISGENEYFCFVTEEPGKSDIKVEVPSSEIIDL